jgi:hypothetical protein
LTWPAGLHAERARDLARLVARRLERRDRRGRQEVQPDGIGGGGEQHRVLELDGEFGAPRIFLGPGPVLRLLLAVALDERLDRCGRGPRSP